MAEKRQLTFGGNTLDVTEVEIKKRQEPFCEYELEDGAVIRVANPSMVVYRVDTQHDFEGNPSYMVKIGTSVVVVRGPQKESNGRKE
jgi:hypothetical protein